MENKNINVPLDKKIFLTAKEVQALTGIGRNNCYQIIKEANCSIRIGRKILVNREVFQQWCNEHIS